MSRRFFITLEVEDMKEFEQLEAFVRDVLNHPEGLQDSTPSPSRTTTDDSKFFCSNPTCSKPITKAVYEFRDKIIQVPLCMSCQAIVREKSSGEEPEKCTA